MVCNPFSIVKHSVEWLWCKPFRTTPCLQSLNQFLLVLSGICHDLLFIIKGFLCSLSLALCMGLQSEWMAVVVYDYEICQHDSYAGNPLFSFILTLRWDDKCWNCSCIFFNVYKLYTHNTLLATHFYFAIMEQPVSVVTVKCCSVENLYDL